MTKKTQKVSRHICYFDSSYHYKKKPYLRSEDDKGLDNHKKYLLKQVSLCLHMILLKNKETNKIPRSNDKTTSSSRTYPLTDVASFLNQRSAKWI